VAAEDASEVGRVLEAVLRDLRGFSEGLRVGATAQLAVALADAIDHPKAAMALAPMAKELRECLAELRAVEPAESSGDVVDDLAGARAARRAASSAG
jgi:hypothetical protein